MQGGLENNNCHTVSHRSFASGKLTINNQATVTGMGTMPGKVDQPNLVYALIPKWYLQIITLVQGMRPS